MGNVIRTSAVSLAGTFILASAGCSSTSQSSGPAMMGGGGPSAPPGPVMTGGDTSYHYAKLACSAPGSLPGHTVTVTLADMGMTQMMGGTPPMGAHMMLAAAPAIVAAGQIGIVAQNEGWRTHELVILPLSAGSPAGRRVPGPDGKVAETGSLGEASADCAAGTGQGIPAGAVGWTTVTLPAGRYELVCNLPNHYADGMHQELTVTAG